MRSVCILGMVLLFHHIGTSQNVTISINAAQGRKAVSPYLYGRNNNFSNVFGTPTSAADIALYKEAGLRFARENNGNNATKYNWQLKISSHPDWYNNVYDHDWDFACETIESSMPGIQAMFAFQLIGKVAANKNNNFNDWGYNSSQWWDGVGQNLAGGGQVNPSGGHDALVEGNPELYLMDWPAASTTGILDHWFGEEGLGFDKNKFIYWSMDNEPEIWNGTHDDVMPNLLTADAFMDKYFDVAKLAREKLPEIKLVGPVPANEWQWYKWGSENLTVSGKYYSWLEYFIMRVAEEEQTTGIRLLDVLDIHWYPNESSNSQVLQSHRIFYDENYVYPGANGLKTINGGWDNTLGKEYIFKRIEDWLVQYFGEGHGITLSLSEFGSNTSDPNVNAVLYASMLGTFANHGVEIFTPWTWKNGMWETLHLFSRYSKNTNVNSVSSDDQLLSAYSSINTVEDSMTVILVNRDVSASRTVTVNLSSFAVQSGNYSAVELSALPGSETFVSHANNALKDRTATVNNNSFQMTLPPLSVTAVLLGGEPTDDVLSLPPSSPFLTLGIYPIPAIGSMTIEFLSANQSPAIVRIFDMSGKEMVAYEWQDFGRNSLEIDLSHFQKGLYFLEVRNDSFLESRKFVVN